jgi:hypothetical protein
VELDDRWGRLGVGRLHATIVEREMVSKSGGGHHALEHFPQHRPISELALCYPFATATRQAAVRPQDARET